MRTLMMAGNWKMHKTRDEAISFMDSLTQHLAKPLDAPALPEVVVAASFTLLPAMAHWLNGTPSPVQVAAQTMAAQDSGAYTGEVSPVQLKDLKLTTVILGHSERRSYYNETDDTINEKTKAALAQGLRPIVCVGETLEEREAGRTDEVIASQVRTCLAGLQAETAKALVIAYEPVWAIGTGKVCEADEANRVCGFIRRLVAELLGQPFAETLRILYGGSMKPENGAELLSKPDIDGGLVGGASLKPDSFYQLVVQAAESTRTTPVAAG